MDLTPAQQQVVEGLQRKGRSLWNTLVIRTKLGLGDIDHGKRFSLLRRYAGFLKLKKRVGKAMRGLPQVRRNKNFQAFSPSRQRIVLQKILAVRRSRKLKNIVGWNRKLAVECACESLSVDFQREAVGGVESQLFHRLVDQYRDSAKRWVQNKRGAGAPRTKNFTKKVSLKAQIFEKIVNGKINLSKFHPILKAVKIKPRSGKAHLLPNDGKVKYVALLLSNLRAQVVLFVEASEKSYSINLVQCEGVTVGIDPGIRTPAAFSTATGNVQGKIEPKNIRRTSLFGKRYARLQRKLDRQRRAKNPECYDEDGMAIKGKHPRLKSGKMRKTLADIARISGTLANRRMESYRLAAREILSRADTVKIGVWRPKRFGGKRTKQKRNLNRSGLDVAISMLAGILDDYARRSIQKKTVIHVNEHLTTRTCPDCGKVQPDKIPITMRKWTCAFCGKEHDRDIAAARNMAVRSD